MILTEGLAAVGQAADRLAVAWVSVQPGDYDPSSGRGPEWGKAAPAGLLIWLFLGIALFFLIKSMNRHMKRVPKTFDTDEQPDAAADSGPTDGDADRAPSEADSDRTLSSTRPDSDAD